MKRVKCILSLAAFVFSVAVHAQNWTSVANSGGANNQTSTDVAEGSGGTTLVVGTYTGGTATFGSRTLNWVTGSSDPLSTTTNGFIARYSIYNSVLWATRIVSSAGVVISSVATDDNGNIYVCGTYSSICEFYNASNPNSTTPVATLQAAPGPGQITPRRGFIAKYSSSGSLQWARRGGGNSEVMTEIAVSDDGSQLVSTGRIYTPDGSISGISYGSYVLWMDPANGNSIRAYNYSNDWTYTDVYKTGLCIDNSNNVIVSARMEGTSYAVKGAAGNITVTSSSGGRSTLYAKYSSSGVLSWARATMGTISSPNSLPSSLIVDANNNIYIAGWASSGSSNYNLQFLSSTGYANVPIYTSAVNNGYVVKLNSSGYALWTSYARNTTAGKEAISLANGGCNFIYVCINTTANPTYTDASGTTISPAISSGGLTISPLNTNGQLLVPTPWIINGLNPATRAQIAPARNNTLKCASTAYNPITIATTGGALTLTPTSGSNDVILGTITYGGPAPTVTFPEQLEVCEGSTIFLNAAVTGTPPFTYTWSVFDIALGNYVTLGTSTSPTFSVSPSVYGSYIIQIFNARVLSFQLTVTDCSGTTVSSNQTVLLKPGILFSQVSGVDVCYKSQITAPNAVFSVNAQNVTSFLWQYSANGGLTWTPCGAGYSGVNTATLTVISPTAAMNNYLFKCKLGGCPSNIETNAALLTVTPCPMRPGDIEKTISSTDQIASDAKLSLYPNPATTNIEVVFENSTLSDNESTVSEAYILDMTGRKVREVSFATGRNTVDVSNLQNGMYSFVVQANGKVIDQQKFIVAH